MSSPVVWTIGHSNHELGALLALVKQHRIDDLVDVRSYPYSRFVPHFNRDELQLAAEGAGIRYTFLGFALGGRPQHESQLDAEGHALYGEMAREPVFLEAIERLLHGAREGRVALLCSCGQPHECHRRLLVGKVLCERGAELRHILPDGTVFTETAVILNEDRVQSALFGDDKPPWRSTRSVSHRRRLSASSRG